MLRVVARHKPATRESFSSGLRERKREVKMVAIIVVLTIASCFFEYKIVTKVPVVGWLLRKYPVASLLFSLGLSMLLGMFFGAAGVMVFVAGICSTMIMVPVYALMRDGKLERGIARIDSSYRSLASGVERNKNNIVAFCHAIKVMVVLLAKIIWFPVKYTLLALQALGNACEWVGNRF